MSIEQDIVTLAQSVDALTSAVNVKKAYLDQQASTATEAANTATTAQTDVTTKAAQVAINTETVQSLASAVGTSTAQVTANAATVATKTTEAVNAAATATAKASEATAASAAINVTANVSAWVATTNYDVGTVVYSTGNYQNYRCIVAGTSATDPKDDYTNWVAVGFGAPDIGTEPNQVPTNGMLGALAYKTHPLSRVPGSSTDFGTTGDIACDSSYFYVCVADNVWKRTAIETW